MCAEVQAIWELERKTREKEEAANAKELLADWELVRQGKEPK